MKKKLFVLALLPLFLCACGSPSKYEETFFSMDTVVTFTVYDEYDGFSALCLSLLSETEEEITVEGAHTVFAAEDGQTVSLPPTVAGLVKKAYEVSALTGGVYDITIAPLVALWDIKNLTEPPAVADIKETNTLVNYLNAPLDDNSITFAKAGMGIDLGSVGKGAAGDIIAERLVENGITAGIISLGGNIRVFGENPRNDDGLFTVGIKDPFDTSSLIGTVSVSETNVVTSGAYERFYIYNRKTYHHILDPRTGYPAESDLASVTVISDDGALADILSTALFAVGRDTAFEVLHAVSEKNPDLCAVLVLINGSVETFNADACNFILYGDR